MRTTKVLCATRKVHVGIDHRALRSTDVHLAIDHRAPCDRPRAPCDRPPCTLRSSKGHLTASETYFMYFPIIGARSCFVCSGTSSGLVMIAVASASLHAQVLAASSRPTASAIVFCAVTAFCVRF